MLTIKKFFVLTFFQAVALTLLKLWFYKDVDFSGIGWQFFYCAVIVILAALLIRTVGVMNYLEAIFIAVVWLVLDFVVDALVTYPLSGIGIFSSALLWVGYSFMMLSVIVFHQKRHIAIRRGQWQDPHAHH